MEKLTGVKVTFIHPPTGQAAEKFNLMMASKEFPDAIEYNWAKYQGGATKAVSDKVLFPLNDIMDEHAPNLASIMKEYPEVGLASTQEAVASASNTAPTVVTAQAHSFARRLAYGSSAFKTACRDIPKSRAFAR